VTAGSAGCGGAHGAPLRDQRRARCQCIKGNHLTLATVVTARERLPVTTASPSP
jgi:hypothetical protein